MFHTKSDGWADNPGPMMRASKHRDDTCYQREHSQSIEAIASLPHRHSNANSANKTQSKAKGKESQRKPQNRMERHAAVNDRGDNNTNMRNNHRHDKTNCKAVGSEIPPQARAC